HADSIKIAMRAGDRRTATHHVSGTRNAGNAYSSTSIANCPARIIRHHFVTARRSREDGQCRCPWTLPHLSPCSTFTTSPKFIGLVRLTYTLSVRSLWISSPVSSLCSSAHPVAGNLRYLISWEGSI